MCGAPGDPSEAATGKSKRWLSDHETAVPSHREGKQLVLVPVCPSGELGHWSWCLPLSITES